MDIIWPVLTNKIILYRITWLEHEKPGEFIEHRKDDVLTRALQTPEHPGRVRCRGAYTTQSSVLGRPARQYCAVHEETRQLSLAYELKISSLNQQLAERDRLIEQRFKLLENRLQQSHVSEDLTSPSHIPTTHSEYTHTQVSKPPQPTQPTPPVQPPPLSTPDVLRKLLLNLEEKLSLRDG